MDTASKCPGTRTSGAAYHLTQASSFLPEDLSLRKEDEAQISIIVDAVPSYCGTSDDSHELFLHQAVDTPMLLHSNKTKRCIVVTR